MELADGTRAIVDPQVRAYVSSLVTALGGSSADEDGRYVLGDDALACLRDLKRWLKLYDEKANRLDVARCLAESNIVGGDLLQILGSWPENETENKVKSKIALACLELLVPLTWPLEKDKETMTVNHHRHIPYLQIAQLGYKRSIINYDGARILHTAVRCALRSMAENMRDRSPRDEGIIKLLLYFIRNIAMIAPPPGVKWEGEESDISRSATIDAFDYQDIFHLLLTISSTMKEDFNTQDVVVLDILFHLVKGVDIEKLFANESEHDKAKMNDLIMARKKEAAMLRSYQATAPSRHNRFGTMAWLRREDEKMSTISGQKAVQNATNSLAKMDSAKKFKPPQRTTKNENGPLDFDTPVSLSLPATKHLRSFVEDFLDSGFNPLFDHIRRAIDSEADRILEYHQRQFFYLVSWFLGAERASRKAKSSPKNKKPAIAEFDSFSLVASVLNQEMFVTLNRAMDSAFENKSWSDLSATMKCFTQILLTVQNMSESPLEEDQEIAENILNRMFYEETTHDRVANITRTYKDQGFGYLDSCTELAHYYLRILEQYSKQNVDLQVRTRRRVRRKKKAARVAGEDGIDDAMDDLDDAENEVRAAEKTSSERKFDFKRFASRFVTQGCVDTFVTFTSYYNDLKLSQLKRSHRFFYRVAFKQEMSVMLFRIDIIALLQKMIKGPEGLDHASSAFKEWDELVKQIFKRCIRKIQERPELVVEMLFSKINSTAHYLEYGYEKQTVSARPRGAAELEVKGGKEWEEQIAIVVGAMLDRNEGEHLEWVKSQLYSAESERRSWEGANSALPSVEKDPIPKDSADPAADKGDAPAVENVAPVVEKPSPPIIVVKADNSTRKIAMFKNGHLRLLMTLVFFQRIGEQDDPEGSWIIPSSVSADQLKESLDLVKKSEFSPPTFDDGQEAGDFIRRKSASTATTRRAVFDDDDDGIDDDEDEEMLFPAGGPTAMKSSEALKELKKKRRLRHRREQTEEEDTDEAAQKAREKAEARRLKEREKNRKIKSELYVRDSDEEDEEGDRAFFEAEGRLREKNKAAILRALLGGDKEKMKENAVLTSGGKAQRGVMTMDSDDDDDDVPISRSKKRQSSAISVDSDEDDVPISRSKKRQSSAISVDSDDGEDGDGPQSSATLQKGSVAEEEEETDTPMSSPHLRTSQTKKRKVSSEKENSPPVVRKGTDGDAMAVDDEDEDEDEVVVARPGRRRVQGGFIVDSSDEE